MLIAEESQDTMFDNTYHVQLSDSEEYEEEYEEDDEIDANPEHIQQDINFYEDFPSEPDDYLLDLENQLSCIKAEYAFEIRTRSQIQTLIKKRHIRFLRRKKIINYYDSDHYIFNTNHIQIHINQRNDLRLIIEQMDDEKYDQPSPQPLTLFKKQNSNVSVRDFCEKLVSEKNEKFNGNGKIVSLKRISGEKSISADVRRTSHRSLSINSMGGRRRHTIGSRSEFNQQKNLLHMNQHMYELNFIDIEKDYQNILYNVIADEHQRLLKDIQLNVGNNVGNEETSDISMHMPLMTVHLRKNSFHGRRTQSLYSLSFNRSSATSDIKQFAYYDTSTLSIESENGGSENENHVQFMFDTKDDNQNNMREMRKIYLARLRSRSATTEHINQANVMYTVNEAESYIEKYWLSDLRLRRLDVLMAQYILQSLVNEKCMASEKLQKYYEMHHGLQLLMRMNKIEFLENEIKRVRDEFVVYGENVDREIDRLRGVIKYMYTQLLCRKVNKQGM